MRRYLTELETRRVVLFCAVFAALMRFPGAIWPIRPDESGFTLVARNWGPEPDSLYGVYWVDRPPPLILLIKVSDWIGGPLFVRVLAALGCMLLVAAAARTAYLLGGDRAARWTALATAAVVANPMIDPISAKGEILGIPLVVSSFWLALEALRVLARSPRRAMLLATGAGFAGSLAIGLKQNMASGLAFGGVLLLASAVLRRISWPDFWRMALPALVGAAIPVAATVGWCLWSGVRLETLWYAVYGFRGDAVGVISEGNAAAPERRAMILVAVFVGTGMALVLGWFLANLRRVWDHHPAATAATVVVVLVDGAGLVLGGSYWRPYLFGLVPAVVLAAALLSAQPDRAGRTMQRIVGVALGSSVISMLVWVTLSQAGVAPPAEIYTGQAIGDVAERDDTIVVYGGHAEIVMASGLDSPYEHLWSLPMRARDPDLDELTGLLLSDRAPTWFVGWVPLDSWTGRVDPGLEAALAKRYRPFGVVCDDHPLWLLRGERRQHPRPDCDEPWGLRNW